jgi:hypothetical protein
LVVSSLESRSRVWLEVEAEEAGGMGEGETREELGEGPEVELGRSGESAEDEEEEAAV